MIVTCEQMNAAEEALFETGVEAEPLMNKAGRGCAEAILQFFPEPARARLFVGKGHNGGDAFVAGRHLCEAGWEVDYVLPCEPDELAPLTAKKLSEFLAARTGTAAKTGLAPTPLILVDGLLGIGAKGPIRGSVKPLAEQLNREREENHGICFAIDIPSGVDGDTGEPYEGAIRADVTLTITYVKTGLIADPALDHVGRLAVIPLPEIVSKEGDDSRFAATPDVLASKLPRLPFSSHKGTAGRVGIVAGSRGFTGAAILSSLGALRAGGGLVTAYVKEDIYPVIASMAPPEIMIRPVSSYAEISDEKLDALAVGPGLGPDPDDEILNLLWNDPRPVIIDADGLNQLSNSDGALEKLARADAPRLLTPHPGEMLRLFPDAKNMESREEIARAFLASCPVTLVYKGARTITGAPDRPLSFNTTGTTGMATPGVGDVLTGICAGFAARGLDLHDAGTLGSWLIGRAGEIATWTRERAPEGLSATDVASALPDAIQSLRLGGY